MIKFRCAILVNKYVCDWKSIITDRTERATSNIKMNIPPSRSMRKYLIIIAIVAVCLAAISIGIGYAIGRAVKTKEYDDAQNKAKESSKVAAQTAMENNKAMHKKAIEEVSTSNLRDNLRSVFSPSIYWCKILLLYIISYFNYIL